MPAPLSIRPNTLLLTLGSALVLAVGAPAALAQNVPSSTTLSPGIGPGKGRPLAITPRTDDDLPPMGSGNGARTLRPGLAPAAGMPARKMVDRKMADMGLRSTPIVEPLHASSGLRARPKTPHRPRTPRSVLASSAPLRGGRLSMSLAGGRNPGADFFAVPTDRKGMLTTDTGRFSYGVGFEFVESIADLRKQKLVSDDALKAGINDALLGRQALVSPQERLRLSEQLSEKIKSTNPPGVHNAMMMLAAKNQAAAEAFLETNKAKPGVTTTASGLQYEVLATGSGPMPAATDTVTVHYRGTLENGTEFDSSYSRGQPATFPLNRVIAGWTEGLQLMNVGARYRFFIPPALGYGARGAGGTIGPNALLIFEVELQKIN